MQIDFNSRKAVALRYRLPSLTALRAFEAAARHESITRAAEELTVSPGAVSRHVTLLEGYFDCRLFHRRQHGLELTEKGRQFLKELTTSFDRIDTACDRIFGKAEEARLTINVYTTFASEWLVPRLPGFNALHPNIDISLVASWRKVSFDTDAIDLAVMTGTIESNKINHDELFKARYFPVCSPGLLEEGPPLHHPADLGNHTLLHSASQTPNWLNWLRRAGAPHVDLERGMAFENSSLAFKAAREGAGVALGQQQFIFGDLVSGQLVAPFDVSVLAAKSYYLACPKKRLRNPHIVEFRNWLLNEVEKSEQECLSLFPRLSLTTS